MLRFVANIVDDDADAAQQVSTDVMPNKMLISAAAEAYAVSKNRTADVIFALPPPITSPLADAGNAAVSAGDCFPRHQTVRPRIDTRIAGRMTSNACYARSSRGSRVSGHVRPQNECHS